MVKYIPYKQLFIYYKSRKNEGVHMEINIGIIAIIVLAIAILAILASGYVKGITEQSLHHFRYQERT